MRSSMVAGQQATSFLPFCPYCTFNKQNVGLDVWVYIQQGNICSLLKSPIFFVNPIFKLCDLKCYLN